MRESCMSESVREASSDRRSTLLECPRKRGGWIKEGLAHADPFCGPLRPAHQTNKRASNAVCNVIMRTRKIRVIDVLAPRTTRHTTL